jgi:hypothetical protein
MANGVRRTRKCVLYHGSNAHRADIGDPNILRGETLPGAGHVGKFQVSQGRPGAQWIELSAGLELRSRDAAVGALSTDELWSKVLVSAGFVRATGGSNALPHTWTLGDIHGASDVPTGDVTPLSTFGLQIDGTAAGSDFLTIEGDNGVSEVELIFEAGQIPRVEFTTLGTLGDGTSSATNLTLASTKTFATEGTGAAWYGSTITVNGESGLVVKSYRCKVNNNIPVRMSAGAAMGVTDFKILERAPGGVLVYEYPDGSNITAASNPDELWVDNTPFIISLTYVAGNVDTAGAAITAKTFTVTQKVYCAERPTLISDAGGILTWSVPIFQDPEATGSDALRISLAA